MFTYSEERPRDILRVVIESQTSTSHVTEDVTDSGGSTLESIMDLVERALLGLGWSAETIKRAFAEYGEDVAE